MGVSRGRLEWRSGSGPPSLGCSEVHVWKVPGRPTGHREAVREELLILIGRYMGVTPGDLQFVIGEYGKPALDPLRHVSAIEFNVSHSHGLGLIALAKNRLVGIDIEKRRGNAGVEAVRRDFLHLPADAGAVDFYAAWTRREAEVKARGGSIVLSRGVPSRRGRRMAADRSCGGPWVFRGSLLQRGGSGGISMESRCRTLRRRIHRFPVLRFRRCSLTHSRRDGNTPDMRPRRSSRSMPRPWGW